MKYLTHIGVLVVGLAVGLLLGDLFLQHAVKQTALGANTYNSPSILQTGLAASFGPAASTTVVNGLSVPIIIREVDTFVSSTAPTGKGSTTTLTVSLSTDCNAESTVLQTATMATATPNFTATSTFSTVANRILLPGQCVMLDAGGAISSTIGFLLVQYSNL